MVDTPINRGRAQTPEGAESSSRPLGSNLSLVCLATIGHGGRAQIECFAYGRPTSKSGLGS